MDVNQSGVSWIHCPCVQDLLIYTNMVGNLGTNVHGLKKLFKPTYLST